MKVSYQWLQTFFDTPLPPVGEVAEALTFHSSEIEELIEVGKDTVMDVKVLPDKSAWLLSHRGIAKEVSTILGIPLAKDPLKKQLVLTPTIEVIDIQRETPSCDRYAGALIEGVKVGPSPAWLKERLESIGQRSINNIVDATNYVMFHLGQPLHAFDVGKLVPTDKTYSIHIRGANDQENITTLTKDEYALTPEDLLIVDGGTDLPIALAGVKGGIVAEVDEATTHIFIESAHFERIAVRKSSQRHKLRTDASVRYENGVSPEMVPYGLAEVVPLILEIAGGTLVGYVDSHEEFSPRKSVDVSLSKINSVLGFSLTVQEVCGILDRFQYNYHITGETFSVTPPFERDDMNRAEDIIEEVGRIYGLEHVPSIVPTAIPLSEINARHYYSTRIKRALATEGFSEIYTSSFRESDTVKLANSLATDKGCLRSTLVQNLREAIEKNISNVDLLGLSDVRLFEMGTVFGPNDESFRIAVGVRKGRVYKEKEDAPLLKETTESIDTILGTPLNWTFDEGIAEANMDEVLGDIADPDAYEEAQKPVDISYVPYSLYPYITRDIALWTDESIVPTDVETVLNAHAGDLCVRTSLFDEYQKDGRISYAFRLVFQSSVRTLTDGEVNDIMERIYRAVQEKGWEIR